ncbi:MAG: hypothetical protein ACRDJJ_05765, partial [Actinomycetota bacterium]
ASGYPDGAEGRRPIYQERILAWLDHYVKGLDVAVGPEIEWQAQDGFYYAGPRFPLPGTRGVEGTGFSATLAGPGPGGGDGVLDGNPAPAFEVGTSAAREVVFEAGKDRIAILGVPRVKLSGSVTGLTAFLFFELVDVSPEGKRVTVDDQTMPLRLGSGGFEQALDLHGISWILEPGHSLELEITTGSLQYQVPRMGPYAVSLEAITELPVANSGAVKHRITSP